MRISGIIEESIVDGPGMRYVIFTQGCGHGCPGCHNPATHDPSGGREVSSDELAESVRRAAEDDPLLDGVTLSGGEPMDQAADLLPVARAAKDAGLDLWIYTGWTIEELIRRNVPAEIELARLADAIVDGRFVEAERTLEVRFIGSRNQRIIREPRRIIEDAGL